MLSPEDSAWETPQPLFGPRSAGPTVQRLVLGGHLRRLREEARHDHRAGRAERSAARTRRSAAWSTAGSGSRSATSPTC